MIIVSGKRALEEQDRVSWVPGLDGVDPVSESVILNLGEGKCVSPDYARFQGFLLPPEYVRRVRAH